MRCRILILKNTSEGSTASGAVGHTSTRVPCRERQLIGRFGDAEALQRLNLQMKSDEWLAKKKLVGEDRKVQPSL